MNLPPLPEALLALAPTRLPNHRQVRYRGDDLCVAIGQLAARDRALLRRFHQILSELLFSLADVSTGDAQKWEAISAWTRRHDLDGFIDEVRELGLKSHAEAPREEVSKAMHDVRGGGLSALLGRLQLLEFMPRDANQLNILFVQARDHLKIMRNAITGLDDPRRQADQTPKAHAMRLMLEKWHESVVGPEWRERALRMEIDCRYEGALTNCCLESAAIDRIFYNLAANACRHAADERLEMVIFALPEPPDNDCLRFVLSNEIGETDAAALGALMATGTTDGAGRGDRQNLSALFEPAVSSTGSGFGLTVVADFVAGAFGLRDRAEALRERYVGATLDGRTFRVWFHWPIARDALPPKVDDYRRPNESLSDV